MQEGTEYASYPLVGSVRTAGELRQKIVATIDCDLTEMQACPPQTLKFPVGQLGISCGGLFIDTQSKSSYTSLI